MVFELTLGFVMAALFILAYLALSRLWQHDERALTGERPYVTLSPADSTRAIGPGTGSSANQPKENAQPNQHRS